MIRCIYALLFITLIACVGVNAQSQWHPLLVFDKTKTPIDSTVITSSGVRGHVLGARGKALSNGLGLFIFEVIFERSVPQEAQGTPSAVILDMTPLDSCQAGLSVLGPTGSSNEIIPLIKGVRKIDTVIIPPGVLSQCDGIQLTISCIFSSMPSSDVEARIALHALKFIYPSKTIVIEDATQGGSDTTNNSGPVKEANGWQFMIAYASSLDSLRTHSDYDETTRIGGFYQRGTGETATAGSWFLTTQWAKYFAYRQMPDSMTLDVEVAHKEGALTSVNMSLGLHSDSTSFVDAQQLALTGSAYQRVRFATKGKLVGFGALSLVFYLNASDSVMGLGVRVRMLRAIYRDSTVVLDFGINASDTSTTVAVHTGNRREGVVREFSLSQNYPNPFNPSTAIRYSIPESQHVTLRIFDLLGREVVTLIDAVQAAGIHSIPLDAHASGLVSGVYIYRLEAGSFVQSRKMILLK